ncbi:hypothetical protein PVT01_000076800 [Plasmodium vivax]|uniref:VIR protein n=1 Tax=Plasmodium vivax TaxID=5855 RepID=A0A1G4E3B2_PLAVI|nr:hypothetical protein PVT01_000076800 [Plasmodium vivax]
MIATENGDTYFNYNDYAEIQGKFLKMFSYSNTFDSNFLEQALNELKVESKSEISFSDLFIKLQKHLIQDGILGWGGKEKGCKYINYVLNKDLIEFNSNIYNETTFKLFNEFKDKFRKYRRRKDHICDLYYIGNDIYDKMNALYILYDIFTSLYPKNTDPDCGKLSVFVNEFNDSVRRIKYEESVFLKKKLNEFINYIKNHEWATRQKCSNKLSHITSLKPDPPVEKEILRPPNPSPTLQSTSISSSDSQSVNAHEMVVHTNGLETSEAQSSRGREPTRETLPYTGSPQFTETHHTTEELQSREVLESTDPIQPRTEKSTLEGKYLQEEEYKWNALPLKRQQYLDGSIHHGVLGSKSIENETLENKGYLKTVRDAVSGFMEGVDPVPVVGVSGGMGALFLLFRYTPVGTFFRGRGRRAGIPTRFDGVYPGFMTDFQGDGFIPNNQYNIAYGAE